MRPGPKPGTEQASSCLGMTSVAVGTPRSQSAGDRSTRDRPGTGDQLGTGAWLGTAVPNQVPETPIALPWPHLSTKANQPDASPSEVRGQVARPSTSRHHAPHPCPDQRGGGWNAPSTLLRSAPPTPKPSPEEICMPDQHGSEATPNQQLRKSTPASDAASWDGSVASVQPAPEGAGEDLHQGAQVLLASTGGGGSKPGQEENPSQRRSRRDRADRADRARASRARRSACTSPISVSTKKSSP